MAKIYERSSCTIIPQGNEKDSSDPRSQTLSGEDSTWMVDRPDIAGVLDCFFFSFNCAIELLWLFENM